MLSLIVGAFWQRRNAGLIACSPHCGSGDGPDLPQPTLNEHDPRPTVTDSGLVSATTGRTVWSDSRPPCGKKFKGGWFTLPDYGSSPCGPRRPVTGPAFSAHSPQCVWTLPHNGPRRSAALITHFSEGSGRWLHSRMAVGRRGAPPEGSGSRGPVGGDRVGPAEGSAACGTGVYGKVVWGPVTRRASDVATVILHQRHGRHVRSGGICSARRLPAPMLWSYTATSLGEALLCGPCRDRAMDASFGPEDALDHSDSGGAFEMDGRRH